MALSSTSMRAGSRHMWSLGPVLLIAVACGSDPIGSGGPLSMPQGSATTPGSTVGEGGNGAAAVNGAAPTSDTGDVATRGVDSPSAGTTTVDGAMGSGTSGGAAGADEVAPAGARPGLAARLSKVEYANSILDVVGVQLTDEELDASLGGIPDDNGDGVFKHFADKQTSVEQHPIAYFQVASAVARRADMQALSAHASCTRATAECGQSAIASLGRRLFRRALDDRELTVFTSLFSLALDEGEDFNGALAVTLQALLQAPQFLFRMENELEGTSGTDRLLSDGELAVRLAAFLWVSVPDDDLLTAAEAGTLSDSTVLSAQVTRMLADPKAQRFTEAFISDFSRAKLASFTGATDDDRAALSDSVTATFQHHFWQAHRSVAELFTTTEFMLNERSAELIDAPYSASGGVQLVDVSMLPERVGLFAHPGMIAGMGDLDVGSFVNRGKVLMERLLCTNPIAVPAGLLDQLEEFNASTEGLNERERAEIRMTRAECWGCHSQFEPLAFGFSRFDGAGRYIGDVDPDGKPLLLDGWVPVGSEANSPRYSNFAEYMNILATEPVVQRCMTEHFLSFATARGTDQLAKAHADVVNAEYIAEGSTLEAMVSSVVKTPLFNSIHTFDPNAALADSTEN